MAAPAAARVEGGPGGEEDALKNLGQHIVLDIAFGAAERVNPDVADEEFEGRGRARHFIGEGPRPDARTHRRLTPLLRTLIQHPEFATSDILIEPPGAIGRPAREFFVPFNEMANHRGDLHAIWGIVGNVRGTGDLYLNCGDRTLPTILVPAAIKAAVYDRYGIEKPSLITGAHVLILGTPFQNGKGKTFCIPDSADHLALILNPVT